MFQRNKILNTFFYLKYVVGKLNGFELRYQRIPGGFVLPGLPKNQLKW